MELRDRQLGHLLVPLKWKNVGKVIYLEPLAEVQRALLVMEVLKAPDPELLGLHVGGGLEHFDGWINEGLPGKAYYKQAAISICRIQNGNRTLHVRFWV